MSHDCCRSRAVPSRRPLLCALLLCLSLCPAARAQTPAPVILTESASTRAVAVEAVTKMRDPFPLTTPGYVGMGADRRTRVVFFVMNLGLLQGEGAKALTADAEDGARRLYELKVEDVRDVPASRRSSR